MRLVFVREFDQETFEVDSIPYGPFMLDKSSVIPGGANLAVTGYEFSGRDGGYQTSAKLERRTFTPIMTLREDHTHEFGLFELIRQAQGFFIPKDENLEPYYYSIQVYTDDRVGSSYQMRNGTISVAFQANAGVGESRAQGQIGFIFGDPYLYPIGDSGLTVELFAGGQAQVLNGRQWDDTDGAMWDDSDGKLWTNAGGSGDPVPVDVISIAPVNVSIESQGELVSPSIVNLTNGSSFTYNGTLGALDVLTVDVLGKVLVNGTTPPFSFSGTLTAINGVNTFALIAAGGSPGSVELTILGAF